MERTRSPRPSFAVVAAAGLVGAAALSACGPGAGATPQDASEPHAIAGGAFEASGVAYVPSSNTVLFVDDGRTREIFLMELTAQGTQAGKAIPVTLGADVTDMEGITHDGQHFYVVGSQSKRSGVEGDGIVRFTFNPGTRRVEQVQRIQGLKAWLAEHVPELRGTANKLGDEVLNIEALAWDPINRRLLLGLRAPVVDGQSLIIAIKQADSTRSFTRENLRMDGATIRLALGGAGIRGMEYDSETKSFRILTGAALNDENQDFRLMEWNGQPGGAVKEIASYSRRLKPEGITRAAIDGRPVSVLMFDVGRFLVAD